MFSYELSIFAIGVGDNGPLGAARLRRWLEIAFVSFGRFDLRRFSVPGVFASPVQLDNAVCFDEPGADLFVLSLFARSSLNRVDPAAKDAFNQDVGAPR